jgi:hypothetical protein
MYFAKKEVLSGINQHRQLGDVDLGCPHPAAVRTSHTVWNVGTVIIAVLLLSMWLAPKMWQQGNGSATTTKSDAVTSSGLRPGETWAVDFEKGAGKPVRYIRQESSH